MAVRILNPNKITIKYANVQHWTLDKATTLATHLSEGKPEIILITSTSKKIEHPKIKIWGYNVHAVNQNNEMNASAAIAIKR